MLYSLAAAFLAGLVGSPHCIGMCGGFAAAAGASGNAQDARAGTTREDPPRALPVVQRPLDEGGWHLGRLATYAVLGALAGAFGQLIPGPGWVPVALSGILMVGFAGVLAGLLPEPRIRIPGLAGMAAGSGRRAGTAGRVLFGAATGLLPCGLVYAALAVPVASGSALVGALSMIAFGLGTAPALLLFTRGIRALALRELWLRRLMAAGVLVAGLVSVMLRQGSMAHLHP